MKWAVVVFFLKQAWNQKLSISNAGTFCHMIGYLIHSETKGSFRDKHMFQRTRFFRDAVKLS